MDEKRRGSEWPALAPAIIAERVQAWRAAVCSNFVELDPEPLDPSRFSGEIKTGRRAQLSVSTIRAGAQIVRRSAEEIRRCPSPRLFFVWQAEGASRIDHKGGATTLVGGEGVLFDPDRPYQLIFDAEFRQVCVQVPRDRLLERVSSPLDDVLGRRLHVRGMNRVLEAATSALLLDEEGAEEPSADMFLDVLARSIHWMGRDTSPLSPATLDYGERLRQFLKRHHADEGLTPGIAAIALGCSIRQIHKVCAALGTTFGRLLIETRLAAAARSLSGTSACAARISDVAYSCGFGDLSHFCRSFKARYGVQPKAYRNDSARNG